MPDREEILSDFEVHLATARGFFDLGEFVEAHASLEEIPPEFRHHTQVVGTRFFIYAKLQKWDLAAEMAKTLWRRDPTSVAYFRAWEAAVSHLKSTDAIANFLAVMMRSGIVDYAGALDSCEVGDIEEAKESLRKAFELNPELRGKALDDPGLAAVWE